MEGKVYNKMTAKEIISLLPYQKPFLFVDELVSISENSVKGTYQFKEDEYFYKGHFKDKPITPGVILTEVMAQIGVVCLGVFLLAKEDENLEKAQVALTSNEIDFFKPVFPNEKVIVESKKVYFRFQKLKCKVEMYNSKNELVCRGTIAGMLKLGL